MEQREENTENIKRKRRRKSSSLSKSASSSSLPLDLATEIFLRLPVKSVFKFHCVSKLWSSITADPYFINSFKTRPKLLFFFRQGNKFFVFTIPQHNPNPNESYSYSSSQTYDSYSITYPRDDCSVTIKTESVHGLICFQKAETRISWNLTVWNPIMRKFLHLRLRKPDKNLRYITVFLGYDPVEGKHKVVCMPRSEKADECWVLTLGSDQESWRMVKTTFKHCPLRSNPIISSGPHKCINGVLYYRAYIGSEHVIMSFDVRSEKFHVIKLESDDMSHRHVMMISYKERLACLRYTGKCSLQMWVLEDAQNGEWSSHKFSSLSHYDRKSNSLFKLIGMTNDGELIYVPKSVLDSFHVIYIDTTRKTLRRVHYRGIADKEFRQRNGLGDERMWWLQYFPNHIETLMSL